MTTWEATEAYIRAAREQERPETLPQLMKPLKPDTPFLDAMRRAHDYHSLPGFTDRLHG